MTAAADDTWIQSSLARLEELESQREQIAASGQTDKLTELDEEIRSLYEVLESVASDDEGGAPSANEGVAPVAVAPVHAAPAAVAAAPMAAAPFAAAPMAAPMGAPPMGAPAAGMQASPPMDYVDDDDDIKPPRGPLLMIVIGLLVLGGGGGIAYAVMNGGDKEVAKPAPTGPAKVIKAGAIVEDTQEPQVAKGAEGDRTRGTNFKEGSGNNDSGATRRRSSGSSSRSSSSSKKPDNGRKIEFSKGEDPLGGVD
ncbi:MAG: hypothetical protein K0V04_08000 [Deltaproteobacteria bacterium]|nr:hypothetical protein [Deltaproteobacteria bacterium]